MIYTLDEIKKRIIPVIEKYSIPAMYLFGSTPEGKQRRKAIWISWWTPREPG